MESEIRNLIKLRGENFHNQNYDFSSIDFNFIGKVDSLQDLEDHPHVSDIRQHGMIAAVEIVKNKSSKIGRQQNPQLSGDKEKILVKRFRLQNS